MKAPDRGTKIPPWAGERREGRGEDGDRTFSGPDAMRRLSFCQLGDKAHTEELLLPLPSLPISEAMIERILAPVGASALLIGRSFGRSSFGMILEIRLVTDASVNTRASAKIGALAILPV